MEEYNYAQLDGNDICVAISQLASVVEQGWMVRITSPDMGLLGKRYVRQNDTWEDITEDEVEA